MQAFSDHGMSIEALAQVHSVDLPLPRPLENPEILSVNELDSDTSFPLNEVSVSSSLQDAVTGVRIPSTSEIQAVDNGNIRNRRDSLLPVESGPLNARNATHHLGEWRADKTNELTNDRVDMFSEQVLSFSALAPPSASNSKASKPDKEQIAIDVYGCKTSGDIHILTQHPAELRSFYAEANAGPSSSARSDDPIAYATGRTINLHTFVGNMPHVRLGGWGTSLLSSNPVASSTVVVDTLEAGSVLMVSSKELAAQVVEAPAHWFGRDIPRIPWIDYLRNSGARGATAKAAAAAAANVHSCHNFLESHGVIHACKRDGNHLLRMRLGLPSSADPTDAAAASTQGGFGSRGNTTHQFDTVELPLGCDVEEVFSVAPGVVLCGLRSGADALCTFVPLDNENVDNEEEGAPQSFGVELVTSLPPEDPTNRPNRQQEIDYVRSRQIHSFVSQTLPDNERLLFETVFGSAPTLLEKTVNDEDEEVQLVLRGPERAMRLAIPTPATHSRNEVGYLVPQSRYYVWAGSPSATTPAGDELPENSPLFTVVDLVKNTTRSRNLDLLFGRAVDGSLTSKAASNVSSPIVGMNGVVRANKDSPANADTDLVLLHESGLVRVIQINDAVLVREHVFDQSFHRNVVGRQLCEHVFILAISLGR